MSKIMRRVTLRSEATVEDLFSVDIPVAVPASARIVNVELDETRYTLTGAISRSTITFTLEWPDESC